MARMLAYLQCTLQNFFRQNISQNVSWDRNDLLWEDHLYLNFKLVPFLQLGTGEGRSKRSPELRHVHKESGASWSTHSSPITPGSTCFMGTNLFTFLQPLGRNKLLLQFRKHKQRGYKSYLKSQSQYNPECEFDLLFWLKICSFNLISLLTALVSVAPYFLQE